MSALLTADPCHVVYPPAEVRPHREAAPPADDLPADWLRPGRPTPEQIERNKRLAAGPTNRTLILLSGLLQVARDVGDRLDLDDWPARKANDLNYDLAGVLWALEMAVSVIDGAILGGPDDFTAGDSHADDIRGLLMLAEQL